MTIKSQSEKSIRKKYISAYVVDAENQLFDLVGVKTNTGP
jgi:hypothetical protein